MFCFLLSLLTLLLNVPVQADRNMFKPSSKVGSFMITPYLALNMFMFRVTIPYQTAETGGTPCHPTQAEPGSTRDRFQGRSCHLVIQLICGGSHHPQKGHFYRKNVTRIPTDITDSRGLTLLRHAHSMLRLDGQRRLNHRSLEVHRASV